MDKCHRHEDIKHLMCLVDVYTFGCWSGLGICLMWTFASKSMRCSLWLDTLSFCRVMSKVRGHRFSARKQLWACVSDMKREKMVTAITWNPNMAWSQPRRSASGFLSCSLGHGRPLVLRRAWKAAWICTHNDDRRQRASRKCISIPWDYDGKFDIDEIGGNLGIAHDSLVGAVRIEREDIVREI
jgi:hypothetical protein